MPRRDDAKTGFTFTEYSFFLGSALTQMFLVIEVIKVPKRWDITSR